MNSVAPSPRMRCKKRTVRVSWSSFGLKKSREGRCKQGSFGRMPRLHNDRLQRRTKRVNDNRRREKSATLTLVDVLDEMIAGEKTLWLPLIRWSSLSVGPEFRVLRHYGVQGGVRGLSQPRRLALRRHS